MVILPRRRARIKTVRLARTIGFPLRYFVAKMYHGPMLVAAERMDQIFDWCQEQRIGWQFDPAYTRMVPRITSSRSIRSDVPIPPAGISGSSRRQSVGDVGHRRRGCSLHRSRVRSAEDLARDCAGREADRRGVFPVASTARRSSCWRVTRSPPRAQSGRRARVHTGSGGGADAAQALETMRALGLERSWERVTAPADEIDLENAIRVIEDYHPLDVECAATALCLLRGNRGRYPIAPVSARRGRR
jgi:asparagine synthase (glutamine-hydrolysing)